jgi:predicted NAD-dependent protein-ADP-ribosyltransferase YbiA (DUF1768 family)
MDEKLKSVFNALIHIGISLPNTFKHICENYEEFEASDIDKFTSTGVNSFFDTPQLANLSPCYSFDFLMNKLAESLRLKDNFVSLSVCHRMHLSHKKKIDKVWKMFSTEYTKQFYISTSSVMFMYYAALLTTGSFEISHQKKHHIVYERNTSVYISTEAAWRHLIKDDTPDMLIDVRTDSEKDMDEMLNKTNFIDFQFVKVPLYKTLFGKLIEMCKNKTVFVRCRVLNDDKGAIILAGLIGVDNTNFLLETQGMKKLSKRSRDFITGWRKWEGITDYSSLVNGLEDDKFTVERILLRYNSKLKKYLKTHERIRKAKSLREKERIGVPAFPDLEHIISTLPKFECVERINGEESNETSNVDLTPLENSYIHPFVLSTSGITYSSVDHYLLSQKFAGMFADKSNVKFCEEIKESTSPISYPLPGFLSVRPDWESIKDGLLEKALLSKFINNPFMESVLLSTGDAKLKLRSDDKRWDYEGKNLLNILLQKIRTQILMKKGTDEDERVFNVWYYTFDSKDTRWKKGVCKIPKSRESCEKDYYYYRLATKDELELMNGGNGRFCYARQRSKHPTIITDRWVFKGPYPEDDESLSLVYHRAIKLKLHKASFVPRIIVKGYNGMYFKSPNVLKEFPATCMKLFNGKDGDPMVPVLKYKNNTRIEFKQGVKIAYAEEAAWTKKETERARKLIKNNPDKINGLTDSTWIKVLHYLACCHFLSVKDCCLDRMLGNAGVVYTGVNHDPGVSIHTMLIPSRKMTEAELCIFYKALRRYKSDVLKKFTEEQTREKLSGREKFRFDSLMDHWLLTDSECPRL